MYYFKYFRNDDNFNKSIRYNELFFAPNSLLNDPMDLWFDPVFWDDIELWKQFIEEYNNGLLSLKDYISQPENDEFYSSLNNLFKGKSLAQVVKDNDKFFQKIKKSIVEHQLATDIDIDSAAKFLMGRIIEIKKYTNFLSVSFSKDPFNYLMWSHYANGFKGCILIYDFEEDKTKLKKHILSKEYINVKMEDVKYSDEPKKLNLWKIMSKNIIDDAQYFFTKNKHWEYERESRLVICHQGISTSGIFHHNPSLVKGIIFGSRCDNNFKYKTIEALKESRLYSDVESFLSFESVLNESNKIELCTGTEHQIKNGKSIALKNKDISDWNNKLAYKANG